MTELSPRGWSRILRFGYLLLLTNAALSILDGIMITAWVYRMILALVLIGIQIGREAMKDV